MLSTRNKATQRKGSRINQVKFNNKSQCERAEGSQNTEKTGGQQIEKTAQRIQVTIVGDSQIKRLDETKLSNHHHQVKIIATDGSRIGQAMQQVGKSDRTLSSSTQVQTI